MGFTDDEVARLLNPEMEGDWESLAFAAAENEDMLHKDVEPNNAATAGHIQKHLDFAKKTNGLKAHIVDRILKHGQAEVLIAAENEIRRAKDEVEKKKTALVSALTQPSAPSGALPPGAMQQQTTIMPPSPEQMMMQQPPQM
jgi:hypothetical protein